MPALVRVHGACVGLILGFQIIQDSLHPSSKTYTEMPHSHWGEKKILCQWWLNSELRISSDLYLIYNVVFTFNLKLETSTEVDVRSDCVKDKPLRQYFRIA